MNGKVSRACRMYYRPLLWLGYHILNLCLTLILVSCFWILP
ncbi:hypothetical protein Hsw_3312 [Hymenobacter swuensis DY53]|uniref:Uncharacterized protein n=1 Tax=Hymenobacter swuensis DY53 TaxID=1227739 RepID=W8F4F8_9BACT|nr:hypothetical protein Hsw_3312 [Hymenobacter swuensis DY53]